MNAELVECLVLGVFHLSIHPDVVLVSVIIQMVI